MFKKELFSRGAEEKLHLRTPGQSPMVLGWYLIAKTGWGVKGCDIARYVKGRIFINLFRVTLMMRWGPVG